MEQKQTMIISSDSLLNYKEIDYIEEEEEKKEIDIESIGKFINEINTMQ